jgi:predicted small lipoprotein YifL
MTTLRQKVLVVVSTIVVTLALVVLPGCGKKEPAKKPVPKKAPTNGME